MKYFNEKEFRSPDEPNNPVVIDKLFMELLNITRELYGKAITINSGYRTPGHNKKVGGASKSSHLLRSVCAADLRIQSGLDRKRLLCSLLKAESQIQAEYPTFYIRLGFGNTFIHVDSDASKPETSFTY